MHATRHQLSYKAFTLIELLAAIAIIAALTTASLYFVGGYVQYAQQNADKQTLTVLNDALTRYKGEGGNVAALTAGAPVGNVIARLKTPVTWGGTGPSHQFLQTAATYSARSLSVLGTGAQYRFTGYNTYTNEPGGSTFIGLNNNLIAWWKFDEGSGTNAADSSGNGYNCGIAGSVVWTTGYNGLLYSLAEISDGAINTGATLNGTYSAFTIAAWLNPTAINGSGIAFATFSGTQIYVFMWQGSSNQYRVVGGTFSVNFFGATAPTSLNTWTHYVFTYDGLNLKAYKNGVLEGSAALVGKSASNPSFSIGNVYSGRNFVGSLDDLRIYNRALSASEVAQLYSQ